MLAVDVSESVSADLPLLKTAAAQLLAGIPADKPVTILAFNNDVFPLAVRQTEPVLRLQALEKLKPWGGTALYDAIILGLARFGQQPGKKLVLVIFTDGEDQEAGPRSPTPNASCVRVKPFCTLWARVEGLTRIRFGVP